MTRPSILLLMVMVHEVLMHSVHTNAEHHDDHHSHDHTHDPGVSSVSIVCEGSLDLEKVHYSSANTLICFTVLIIWV